MIGNKCFLNISKRLKLLNLLKNSKLSNSFYTVSYKNSFFTRKTVSEESKEKQEIKQFANLKQFLLEREKYNWEDYHQQTLSSLKEANSFINRMKKNEEKDELIMSNKFCSALMDHEKDKFEFDTETLVDVRNVTGLNLDEIDYIIYNFKYYLGVHGYLKQKQKKDEKLPDDYSELQEMIKNDKPDFYVEIQRRMFDYIRKKQKLTNKQQKISEQKTMQRSLRQSKHTWKY